MIWQLNLIRFAAIGLAAMCWSLVAGSTSGLSQTASGIAIGDSLASTVERMGNPAVRNDFGPITAVKWILPDNNEISVSAVRATDKIVYIETNWGEWQSGKLTDFPALRFGDTNLSALRKQFRSNGYMRRPPITNKDGSIVMFNTYNIEGGTNISITFATKTTLQDGSRVVSKKTTHGDVAKLDTIIIADNSYLDAAWGKETLGAPQTISLNDLIPNTVGRKLALVIGNGDYRFAQRLPNPRNDAEDVSAALKRMGFEIVLAIDESAEKLRATLTGFAQAASTADVALIYYSGHAIQHSGTNYLIAVDQKLTDQSDLPRLISAGLLVEAVAKAKRLKLLVLDSCRDSPLTAQLSRSIGGASQRGLAKMDASAGMIIAFATQAGRTADDGIGRNSPFTSAFLKHIDSNSEIGATFRRIGAEVFRQTNKAQLPELSISLSDDIHLRPR